MREGTSGGGRWVRYQVVSHREARLWLPRTGIMIKSFHDKPTMEQFLAFIFRESKYGSMKGFHCRGCCTLLSNYFVAGGRSRAIPPWDRHGLATQHSVSVKSKYIQPGLLELVANPVG